MDEMITPSNPQQLAEACAERMYRDDHASRKLGMELVRVTPGFAQMTMSVTETMVNGHDVCHGGYLFTLADSTFAFACNTYNDVTLAQSASIDFLRPATLGDKLLAEAVERSRGRRTGVYDVTVTRADGKVIALFRGKSFQLGRPTLTGPSKETDQ